MRTRVILIGVVVVATLAGALLLAQAVRLVRDEAGPSAAGAKQRTLDSIQTLIQPPPPPPTLRPGPVSLRTKPPFWSWALLDRNTLEINGSPNLTKTNTTESMIKAWIVSDYLRRAAERKQTPTADVLQRLSVAIRDSNDDAAQWAYQQGGRDAVITRLIKTCGLTETKLYTGWWSLTQMSARDAARMGLCIADERAAGPTWTGWVLEQMRQVRGTVTYQQKHTGGGRWGIIDGLPPAIAPTVSMKNGWWYHPDGRWHINCLAIGEDWVLAVQAQYPYGAWRSGQPIPDGLAQGAEICRSVAQQLVTRPAVPQ